MLDLVRGQQSNKPLSVVVMGEYVRKQADTFISPVISIFALSIYIFVQALKQQELFEVKLYFSSSNHPLKRFSVNMKKLCQPLQELQAGD